MKKSDFVLESFRLKWLRFRLKRAIEKETLMRKNAWTEAEWKKYREERIKALAPKKYKLNAKINLLKEKLTKRRKGK